MCRVNRLILVHSTDLLQEPLVFGSIAGSDLASRSLLAEYFLELGRDVLTELAPATIAAAMDVHDFTHAVASTQVQNRDTMVGHICQTQMGHKGVFLSLCVPFVAAILSAYGDLLNFVQHF